MITGDITIFVNRMQRANIPLDHVCYELDEHEWQLFCRELEALHVNYSREERDYSYVENMRYMGIPVRKRTDNPGTAK
jgi:hypothetical protein